MNIFFTCLFIGISLSMDAFSLALIYGTCGLSFKKQLILSIVVGCFHFFMPLIGILFGSFILDYFMVNANLIVGVIFSIIGLEMIFSYGKNEDIKVLDNFISYLLFGFTVSVDSLTTGIGLSAITDFYVGVCFLFMVLSGMFTYLGVRLGRRFYDRYGRYANIFGGIIMVLLSFYYLFFK